MPVMLKTALYRKEGRMERAYLHSSFLLSPLPNSIDKPFQSTQRVCVRVGGLTRALPDMAQSSNLGLSCHSPYTLNSTWLIGFSPPAIVAKEWRAGLAARMRSCHGASTSQLCDESTCRGYSLER